MIQEKNAFIRKGIRPISSSARRQFLYTQKDLLKAMEAHEVPAESHSQTR